MNLDDINIDFDVAGFLEGIKDGFFKTVRIILMMIYDLPTNVKITIAVLFVFIVIGIGYLTWKYRDEWKYVKY